MTVINVETGELIEPMSVDAARRLTERIRIAATNYTDAKAKVLQLVDEAKAGSAHLALGYKSWTAYLSDTLSDEPLRLAREDRRELVTRLADEGMSTRAIAPIVGVSDRTVAADIEVSTAQNFAVDPAPQVRTTTGLDGRERTTVTSGQLRPAPNGTTERNHQEAELVNAVTSVVRPLTKAHNVSTLSPNARNRLIQILDAALETLKEGTS